MFSFIDWLASSYGPTREREKSVVTKRIVSNECWMSSVIFVELKCLDYFALKLKCVSIFRHKVRSRWKSKPKIYDDLERCAEHTSFTTHIYSSRQLNTLSFGSTFREIMFFRRKMQRYIWISICFWSFQEQFIPLGWHFHATFLAGGKIFKMIWGSNRAPCVWPAKRKRKIESWNIYRVMRERKKGRVLCVMEYTTDLTSQQNKHGVTKTRNMIP